MFLTLIAKGVLGKAEVQLSIIGVIIILGAVAIGTWLRDKISQEAFRKVLLLMLIGMAMNMLKRGLL